MKKEKLPIILLSLIISMSFIFCIVIISIVGIYYIPTFNGWLALAITFGVLFFLIYSSCLAISIYFFILKDKLFPKEKNKLNDSDSSKKDKLNDSDSSKKDKLNDSDSLEKNKEK